MTLSVNVWLTFNVAINWTDSPPPMNVPPRYQFMLAEKFGLWSHWTDACIRAWVSVLSTRWGPSMVTWHLGAARVLVGGGGVLGAVGVPGGDVVPGGVADGTTPVGVGLGGGTSFPGGTGGNFPWGTSGFPQGGLIRHLSPSLLIKTQ